ncbi:MAG: aminoglycoside phosphotransferase family protein [Zetaproteobacteria bacterium]|nr:MAG: aminoglycoside phosphotransferase family protein [Zetaproteobacteria bacterium]
MRLFAKCYFRHPSDPRDRLGAELRFLTFARAEGICNVPEPVAADPDQGIALFRQIEGRRLRPEEIGADHVRAAAVFVDRLNRAREAGGDLPRASDAFFRIAEQCTHLEGRIETLRWETARRDGPLQREAAELVGRIATAWHRIRGEIVRIVDPAAELPTTQRCISPSDFGFHNALLTDGGELCFLDFEYAGWDDPAKLCCDFFCQPDLPVPLRYSGLFIEEALKSFAPAADMLAMRAAALFPLFSLKWCCIMLNPFLPGGARRRRFADGGAESERRLRRQLDRAAEALDRMEDGRLGLR